MRNSITIVGIAALLAGCGPTGRQWQEKLEEIEDLKMQLDSIQTLVEWTDVQRLESLERENAELREALAELGIKHSKLEGHVKKFKEAELLAKQRMQTMKKMLAQLKDLIAEDKLVVTVRHNKMVIELPSEVLFAPGSNKLSSSGKETLALVATVLADIGDREFQVAGHTDDVPKKHMKFASNWELSTARALAVVAFLQKNGVPAAKLSAAGYGEFQPVAENDSDEGKSWNRRIEIVLVPKLSELPDLGELASLSM